MGMGDSNPAAVPHAAEDVQGDDRWMSQVRLAGGPSGLGGMLGQCCPGHTWDLEVTTACHTCVSCRDGAKEEGSSLMRSDCRSWAGLVQTRLRGDPMNPYKYLQGVSEDGPDSVQ